MIFFTLRTNNYFFIHHFDFLCIFIIFRFHYRFCLILRALLLWIYAFNQTSLSVRLFLNCENIVKKRNVSFMIWHIIKKNIFRNISLFTFLAIKIRGNQTILIFFIFEAFFFIFTQNESIMTDFTINFIIINILVFITVIYFRNKFYTTEAILIYIISRFTAFA